MEANKWELVIAARELNDRGLVHSAKWLFIKPATITILQVKTDCRVSELAVSLPPSSPPDGYQSQLFHCDMQWIQEADKYMFAKACFDCKEYSRAAFHLQRCTSRKSVFLRGYSLYLVRLVSNGMYCIVSDALLINCETGWREK